MTNNTLPPKANNDKKAGDDKAAESVSTKTAKPKKAGAHTSRAAAPTTQARRTGPGWVVVACLGLLSLPGLMMSAASLVFIPKIDRQSENNALIERELATLKSNFLTVQDTVRTMPDDRDQIRQIHNDHKRLEARLDVIDSLLPQTSAVSAANPDTMTDEQAGPDSLSSDTQIATEANREDPAAPVLQPLPLQSDTDGMDQNGVTSEDSSGENPHMMTSDNTNSYQQPEQTEPNLPAVNTDQNRQKTERIGNAALAFLAIETAASQGYPFQEAQRRLATALPDNTEVERLAALSVIPVPTIADLRAEFQTVMIKAVETDRQIKPEGWLHTLFGGGVTARHKPQEKLDITLNAAHDALNRGNMDETRKHLESLDSSRQAVFTNWIAKMRRRQDLDEILNTLRVTIITQEEQ